MGEQGLVVSISDDFFIVSLVRNEACAKCRACTAGFSKKEMILKVQKECDANINDWVNIELEPDFAIKAVLIMYGIPLIFLLGGIFSCSFAMDFLALEAYKEAVSFAAGIACMFLAYALIKRNEKNIDKQGYTPKATAVIQKRTEA